MNDVPYLLLTLAAFALLALLVGALARYLDDPADRVDPADPADPTAETTPTGPAQGGAA
ncbi:hypothetical protein [Nocardioides dongxiaopingii]|uniref:hypothetical protein n=1 Tax=Nocardioides TaxID=1839 RepID=UPI0014855C5A|nr:MULTISPECIES: hypothetical protein [Nocardioides]